MFKMFFLNAQGFFVCHYFERGLFLSTDDDNSSSNTRFAHSLHNCWRSMDLIYESDIIDGNQLKARIAL